ncbi:hypothetical protein D3C72_2288250 [compost metagenome]
MVEADGLDHFISWTPLAVEIADQHMERGDAHIGDKIDVAIELPHLEMRVTSHHHRQQRR